VRHFGGLKPGCVLIYPVVVDIIEEGLPQ